MNTVVHKESKKTARGLFSIILFMKTQKEHFSITEYIHNNQQYIF